MEKKVVILLIFYVVVLSMIAAVISNRGIADTVGNYFTKSFYEPIKFIFEDTKVDSSGQPKDVNKVVYQLAKNAFLLTVIVLLCIIILYTSAGWARRRN